MLRWLRKNIRYVEVDFIGTKQFRRRKKLLYITIYVIDLRNIEVELIDIKTEKFGTFKKPTFCQKLRLIEVCYSKVSLYFYFFNLVVSERLPCGSTKGNHADMLDLAV